MVASDGSRALHDRQGFTGGRLRGALERGDVARRTGASGLTAIGFVHLVEDVDEGAWLELIACRGNLLQARGLAEGAQESAALRAGLAEAAPLAEDDGPRVNAGNEQDSQNCECDGSTLLDHFDDSAAAFGSIWTGGVGLKVKN